MLKDDDGGYTTFPLYSTVLRCVRLILASDYRVGM